MEGMKAYILPGVAALVLLAYYGYRAMAEDPPAASASVSPAPAPSAKSAPSRSEAPAPTIPPKPTTASPAPTTTPLAPPSSTARPTRDRAQRDALRTRLEDAQRRRLRAKDDAPVEPEALGSLTKEYIQERVREDLLPLATECYAMALEDDDALAGRLVMQFRIVGEPDVGGIVQEVQMAEDSEIQHADLVECMRESMMSVSFDPPEDGGTLVVHYPFVFEPREP
ncbi:MAG: AgmX/PglI C-terminal domain-containing protein [Myxococcota bacterium]